MSDKNLSVAAGLAVLAISLFVATAAQAATSANGPYSRDTYLYAHMAPDTRPSNIYGTHPPDDSIWPTASTAPRNTSASLPRVAPYIRGKTTFPWGDAWPFSAFNDK
jgi:hypothetical protein